MENKLYDVAIVGSGPAGLTAAIYTARGGAKTIILGGEKWGGQLMLTTLVENFPGFPDGVQGPDLMLSLRKQAVRFGTEFLEKSITSVNFLTTPFELLVGAEKYLARVVIIATGAQTLWLNVPGIRELIGRGISSCAPCDAPFFKDKRVAVVGGGDAAMEETLVLTKYAAEVTIIHRRDSFRASEIMQRKVLDNPKVKVLWNTEVKEVMGSEKLEKLVIKNNQTQKEEELPVDGLFVAIGHKPDNEVFGGQIEKDEKSFIKRIRNQESGIMGGYQTATSVPGVFVAGDVEDSVYKQAITAAGEGCKAGMEAVKYLENTAG